MFRRKAKPEPAAPLAVDKLRVTLTIATVDPDAGSLTWTGHEDADKTLDALETAITTLAARGVREATED